MQICSLWSHVFQRGHNSALHYTVSLIKYCGKFGDQKILQCISCQFKHFQFLSPVFYDLFKIFCDIRCINLHCHEVNEWFVSKIFISEQFSSLVSGPDILGSKVPGIKHFISCFVTREKQPDTRGFLYNNYQIHTWNSIS